MVVGLVGCGRWGAKILRDLRSLECAVPVVARSDASVARAREGDASAVVADVSELRDVDGIVVATTTSSHGDVVEAALDHGVPVFVEKPLCTDAKQAGRLSEIGRERLFVMDKWRYHPGVLELAAIASSERLGPVRGLSTARVGWGQEHDDVDSAWVLAPHDLSIALEIFGRLPEPVRAVGMTSGEDVLHMEAVLNGDGVWHTLTVSTRVPEYRRTVELYCADGTAPLAGGWDEHVRISRGPEGERVETPGELPLIAELRAFVEHLRGGPPPKSSAEEGAQVVAAVQRLRQLVLAS